MNLRSFYSLIFLLLVFSCTVAQRNKKAEIGEQQLPVKCMENSPERRGAEGCTILANRPLLRSATKALYWHIDRFDSLEVAKQAVGPDGVAAEAHGSAWLMTVEDQNEEHHGGQHMAWIGPLVLPSADRFNMRVQSSLLMPGSTTPVHTHSGPEIIYIVDGEQCIETPEVGQRLSAGQSYMIPGGGVHRGHVTGSSVRRALALILYDANRAASHDLFNPPPLVQCK